MRGQAAALAVEGAVDTPCFDSYLKQVLAPKLRPGDVAVPDSPGVRASRIEEAAARRGAQVPWLSPYSPGFGPVEHRRS